MHTSNSQRSFALRSSRVVTPEGVREAVITVSDGRVTKVCDPISSDPTPDVEDLGDLVIMPGLVDIHVHVNEPGRTEWEGFQSATQAAVAGGVTTIVDMPLNSSPVTTDVSSLEAKQSAAQNQCWCDVGFFGGLVPGNHHQIGALIEAGVLGIKVFLCPSGNIEFPAASAADIRPALGALASYSVPLLVHAELPNAPSPFPSPADVGSYAQFCKSRPEAWEFNAIALLIELCSSYNIHSHIVHLSSGRALPLIDSARQQGLVLTVETCPHYLFFAAEDIKDGDTRLKCAPPIRDRANQKLLWNGLVDGVIDTIGTDHSPCPPALKPPGDFTIAWGGIASLQLGLAAVWSAGQKHDVSVDRMAHWMAQRPAELIALDRQGKGKIQAGGCADLVVWDPDASWTVDAAALYHRHPLTPYQDCRLRGHVRRTYLNGQLVYENGNVVGEPRGRLLRRTE